MSTINYNLFADDPKKTGKEFKVIFRTKNIRKRNTSFLTCLNENIGLDMKVENATIYNSGGLLKSDYCEDTIIEYEFNINKDTDKVEYPPSLSLSKSFSSKYSFTLGI